MGKYKVFINAGHGGRDSGAVGFVVEKNVNLIMAKAAKEYLEKNNVEVYMHEDDLADRSQSSTDVINACESFKPDIAIDCHANAGGGDGFEIYKGISGLGDKLAEYIEDEVKKIGQNSRGIKTRKNDSGKDYYYFIRQTSCPAVICEAAFVDNKTDVEIISTDAKCKAFGEAYARGILRYFNININDAAEENSDILYRVQVGAYKDKNNAENMLNKLLAEGYEAYITTNKNV